jgi:hypothetical protein
MNIMKKSTKLQIIGASIGLIGIGILHYTDAKYPILFLITSFVGITLQIMSIIKQRSEPFN